MNIFLITVFSFLILFTQSAFSAESNKVKYYKVLNDDHGILAMKTLSNHNHIRTTNISKSELKKLTSDIIWQCFPRKSVKISLQDRGYSSEDLKWKENHSNLVITVFENEKIKHEYTMRRFFGLSNNHARFLEWIKLMKNEPYVCLAGNFIDQEQMNSKYEHHKIFSWIFDALKTQKGCDSYLAGLYEEI